VLLEHNWDKLLKADSNPSQARRRIVENYTRAINDLTLLAAKLPNEEFNKIFNENTIKSFVESLLFKGERIKKNEILIDVELSAIIASVAVKACKDGYNSINKDSPNIAETVIEYLDRTIAICGEIGYKIFLENIEKEQRQKNKQYICRIEEVMKKDKLRFLEYASNELNLGLNLSSFHAYVENKYLGEEHIVIFFTFVFEEGSDVIGTIKLDVDYGKNTCRFLFESNIDDDAENVERSLIIKPYYKYHLLLK
jgi:hypothetical protein